MQGTRARIIRSLRRSTVRLVPHRTLHALLSYLVLLPKQPSRPLKLQLRQIETDIVFLFEQVDQVLQVGLQQTEEVVYFLEVFDLLEANYVLARCVNASVLILDLVVGNKVSGLQRILKIKALAVANDYEFQRLLTLIQLPILVVYRLPLERLPVCVHRVHLRI